MGMMKKFWSRIFGKKEPAVPTKGFVLHDPAAQRPHDLDDPYFDAKIQERLGKAIGGAVRKSGRTKTGKR
jgi:hypothetical protein